MAMDERGGLAATIKAFGPGLRAFIRRRIADRDDADDLFQDVLADFVAAYRLLLPIERAGAWLMRVARNRIIDRYRSGARARRVFDRDVDLTTAGERTPALLLNAWLAPAPDQPEAAYDRMQLLEELELAIASLPSAQREVFVAHELDGRSFKEMAADSGESINTLLGRKHSAVNSLRARLQSRRIEFHY